MYAQLNYSTYPSNIKQICVTLYNDTNSTQLTYPNGTIVPELVSETNDTSIEGWYEGVKVIRVHICNTTDQSPPKNFRFAVVGCFSSSRVTYIMQQSTNSPRQLSTTPTDNSSGMRKKKIKYF